MPIHTRTTFFRSGAGNDDQFGAETIAEQAMSENVPSGRFVDGVSLCLVLLALWLPIELQGQEKQSEKDRASPHPWLSQAPAEYARLLRKGNVSIVMDDNILRDAMKNGLTRFDVHLEYKCSFDFALSRDSNESSTLRIRGKYLKRDMQVSHVIYLPSTLQPSDPWKHPLLLHEMDHVAITTDPRLQPLVDAVFSIPFQIDAQWELARRPTNQDVQAEIDQSTQRLIKELESFLQLQYDQLDVVSGSGLEAISDRSRFFKKLYSAEFLETHKPALSHRVPKEEWERRTKINKSKLEMHYLIDL